MAQENEIEKFDATKAMQSVKEKIKDAFVSLIPDEQWNEMVKKEIDFYFKETTEQSYGNNKVISSFKNDVHSVLKEEVVKRTKEYLLNEFNNVWMHNGVPTCNAKVQEFIVNNSGKILADMIGGTISMALQNAGYRMS